jgi:hypothetical protein
VASSATIPDRDRRRRRAARQPLRVHYPGVRDDRQDDPNGDGVAEDDADDQCTVQEAALREATLGEG